jgi:hypothetical protein
MRRFIATIAAAGAASLMLASGVSADPVAGPTAFEFSATCSGMGSVILTNAGPAFGALHVVGTNAIVLVPVQDGVGGIITSPGLLTQALAAGTTCTFTGGGPPGNIEPFDPITLPVVIVNG